LAELSSCFPKKTAESWVNCVVVGNYAWNNGAKSGFPFRRLLRLLAKDNAVFVVDEHRLVSLSLYPRRVYLFFLLGNLVSSCSYHIIFISSTSSRCFSCGHRVWHPRSVTGKVIHGTSQCHNKACMSKCKFFNRDAAACKMKNSI
jgi:hypothetical protein